MLLMTGLKSGSADATPAPGVNDNARAPTAASSLANDSVPICGRPSNQRTAQPETADDISVANLNRRRPRIRARLPLVTKAGRMARQRAGIGPPRIEQGKLLDAQRKRWGEPSFGTVTTVRTSNTGVDDDERQALRAEGLDSDDPAVIAAIDLVRWELSLGT